MVLTVMVVAAVMAFPVRVSAGPQSACTFNEAAARLEITIVGSPNVLYRAGEEIELNGTSVCDGATVHNTDLIAVTAEPSISQALVTLRISLRHGTFEPGATDEGPASAIEIQADFTRAHDAALSVFSGRSSQGIGIAGDDIDLNPSAVASEADVLVSRPDDDCGGVCHYALVVSTGSGSDWVVQRQADGVTPVTLLTGPGDDFAEGRGALLRTGGGDDTLRARRYAATLEGGGGDDVLIGGPRNDRLEGSYGADRIYGRGRTDDVHGMDGPDIIVGGRGRDALYGQQGNDRMWGGRSRDQLDGGNGYDRCELDARTTLMEQACEERLFVSQPPPWPF